MEVKSLLKTLKLNESTISMVLGALVVLVVGLLVVNYFRGRAGEIAQTTNQEAGAEEEVSLPTTHSVSEGEHLWVIAERYFNSGYNWVDIAEANELTNPNVLLVGQELTIPDVEPRLATVEPQVQQATAFGSAIEGGEYTVAEGDHLWGIAVRAYQDGYRWVDIARANDLSNPNVIVPEQNLTIPR